MEKEWSRYDEIDGIVQAMYYKCGREKSKGRQQSLGGASRESKVHTGIYIWERMDQNFIPCECPP